MKKLSLLLLLIFINDSMKAQCNINNATSCVCADSSQKCKLLPDITIGRKMLMDSTTRIEYSQTGNGVENGRLRISVPTPNIGHGPLTVKATNTFICGTDTFYGTAPAVCPNGDLPKQLIVQRVYSKKGAVMSYFDRPAGTMTYHPTHQHMHVDDWGIYTLRTSTSDPNPLNWPIIGTGAKLAFCLMDLSTCSGEYGNCVNSNNDTLINSDFPNYGLGGGNYTCSPTTQGISSGYVDYYDKTLDGMWINIPPGTCNGDYWIVTQIDPYNYFDEENESNNVVATPITLTQQTPIGGGAVIANLGAQTICDGSTTTLQANIGNTYLWNTGATTQTINVSAPGTYMVTVDGNCGVATSQPYVITMMTPALPVTQNSYFVAPGATTVAASAPGQIDWYDALVSGNFLGTGSVLTTGILNATTNFYAENTETKVGATYFAPPNANSIGGGGNHTNQTRYLIFDALKDFKLVSVKVYATGAGNRTIQLRDTSNQVLQTKTVFVPDSESRITLDFPVLKGNSYRLGMGSTPNFFRNNTGVQYPYHVNAVLDITGSSEGSAFYYFFYDWEVKEPDVVCTSPRVAATAFSSTSSIAPNNTSLHCLVSPNPAHSVLSLTLDSDAEINLINIGGKSVLQQKIQRSNGSISTIDVSAFARGIYLLQLQYPNSNERKIIVLD